MSDQQPTFDSFLQERLFDQRVVVARGVLDAAMANRTSAQLLALQARAAEPVRMHLACAEGELGAALSLADTIRALSVELTAVAVGEVSGAALGVLAAAPRRVAYPHARFRLVEPPATHVRGRATEVGTVAEEYARMVRALTELLAEATGQHVETVLADLRQGRFLTTEQALSYGLLDTVVTPGRPS
ncbi:ATP-dependent Clp protease proteolytic subunit [Thermasporomyces composti]|jgi:ATP-dependent Clp protease protease subunit|uniref:ATP-dependent Clp protease proteolytic subunit n=1 Tax=Thermasporomyces composti TaxID=696763 RepID=A0A3D9UZH0_THECX|nr:ATP-dependent Clp protease proteolytic subunit [Thermasporomyces composti]REF34932.1 ATP-dependent Clp protease protease subunit [Thermasporomyces composti]